MNATTHQSQQDKLIGEVYRRIERERAIIQGSRAMRSSTDNASVQQRCDTSIREAQKNIAYLEEVMSGLKLRNAESQGQNGANSDHRSSTDVDVSNVNNADGEGPPPVPEKGVSRQRPNFTRLDLIKYDIPHIGPRIQLMLQQLEFKLSVEQQYKQGIDKMLKLYQLEGDRRSKTEAEGKRIESTQKIQLLKKALKRYSDMHISVTDDITDDSESIAAANLRRPLTGVLHIACYGVKDVDHVASGRFAKIPESMITFKIEDQPRARTRFSRNERWSEDFHLSVDNANEIEIVVYDRSGDHDIPVGLMWLRISDIAEALRRKKVEQGLNTAEWVSASKVQSGDIPSGLYNTSSNDTASGSLGRSAQITTPSNASTASTSTFPIDSWFVLEPAGQIHLAIDFEKTNKGQKRTYQNYDHYGALGRQGAIRQKKEEVHEVHGHKFVQHQFYNIMRCALCGDFLKYSAGYQCQDCRYTCHKKCYLKVVTKCISRASTDSDPDEEKLNHRIPHRFEPATNMGANWCCHCGYILPLGKKNVRKCTECGLTCHPNCVHLVPDLCGLSMEAANQILSEIKSTKIRKQATGSTASTAFSSTAASKLDQSASNHQKQVNPYGVRSVSGTSTTARPPPRKEPIRRKEVGSPASTMGIASSSDTMGRSVVNMESNHYHDHRHQHSPVTPTGPKPKQMEQANNGYAMTGNEYPNQASHRLSNGYPQQGQSNEYSQRGPGGEYPQHGEREYPQHGQSNEYPPHAQSNEYSSHEHPSHEHSSHEHSSQPSIIPVVPDQREQRNSYHPETPSQSRHSDIKPTNQVSPKRKAKKKKIGLDDFNFVSVLGKGNFGKVMLAESKKTTKLYAIKVLKKDFIIENDEVESTRSEKRVFLIAMKHPFLTNLHSCFQTENRVYFVMEYVNGGDLMWHIQKELFTPRRAQFYAAEVLLALKYFHDNGVIYRDLKLDNILLTLSGHIKIADYGLCKEDMWYGKTTSTFCGTPDFMAPEILLDQKYSRAVDWWAFGVLIYQMLLGKSPFRGDDEDEVFDAILRDEPLYPIHMPRDSVSILQQLLTRDPQQRLGAGPRDAHDIMEHAYFSNINFDDIYNMRVPPPYTPKISSPTDVTHFDTDFTSEPPALTPVNSVLTPQMQEQFKGFSYMNEDSL